MTKDGLSIEKGRKIHRSAYLIFGAILTVAMAAFPVIISVQAERSEPAAAAPEMLAPCTPVSFTNSTAITLSATSANNANPYPSTISVSGLQGNVVTAAGGVEVTLNGFTHTYPDDVGVLLVGPTGAAYLLQDGAGDDPNMANVTYKLSDLGQNPLPDTTAWAAGTYRPTTYYSPADPFPAPGPDTNYQLPALAGSATFASVFGGTAPNGTWSLFVRDFQSGDGGEFAGGWTITITSDGCAGGSPTPSPSTTPSATPTTTPSPSPSTTPPSGTVSVAGTNLGAIPDNDCNGTGRQVSFNVSGLTGPISNIRVGFTGTHSYIADLDVRLIAPGSVASQDIFTYVGNDVSADGDSSDLNGTYVFFDTATGNLWAAAAAVDGNTAVPPGNYKARNVNNEVALLDPAFANLGNPNGVWILKFNDCTSSDTGSVTAATLTITGQSGSQLPSALDVAGRVVGPNGFGIKYAVVTITGPGNFKLQTLTNALGYYEFENVPTGVTYTITVTGKRHTFTPRNVPLTSAAAAQQDFVGQPIAPEGP
jgi:subtilisin-like proprotein convertase family protein